MNQDLPNLVVDFSGLSGGQPGTAKVVPTTRRNYSSDLFIDPVDYRWMKTYAPMTNIMVTVNGIDSICKNTCSYTFINQIPILKNLTLNSNILLI